MVTVDSFHRPIRLQLSCSKPIRHVHPFHASEVKRISAQPKDEISSTEETQSSAVRTVALWVGESMLTMLLLIFFGSF